jgi:hypothetical protein
MRIPLPRRSLNRSVRTEGKFQTLAAQFEGPRLPRIVIPNHLLCIVAASIVCQDLAQLVVLRCTEQLASLASITNQEYIPRGGLYYWATLLDKEKSVGGIFGRRRVVACFIEPLRLR